MSLRNVEVLRYDPATVVISQGLDTGALVVTAGVQRCARARLSASWEPPR